MKLLISGGHLTPALAFIDHVQKVQSDIEFTFVGRIYSREKTKQKAKEKEEIEKRGIPFTAFQSGKLGQESLLLLPVSILKMCLAFFTALALFLKEKPQVYLSFGSYLSIPLALASWVLRIPIVVHEQTRTVGIANALVSRFATAVAVSYPESKKQLSHSNVVLTGNPIRETILSTTESKPAWLTTKSSDPLLLVIGGSQGSEIINTTVVQSLPQLTKKWIVIHQCGAKTKLRNYKKELEKARKSLSLKNQKRYFIHEWLTETELAWIYTHVDCAVSRAGANTVQELSVRHVPALYIPLPFSHHNEQYLNAKALADTGQAMLLMQKDATPAQLVDRVYALSKNQKKVRQQLKIHQNNLTTGSQKLLAVVQSIYTA